MRKHVTLRCILVLAGFVAVVPTASALARPTSTNETPTVAPAVAIPAAEQARDASELRQFETLVSEMLAASEDRGSEQYRSLNTRVLEAMEREVDQARIRRARLMNRGERPMQSGLGDVIPSTGKHPSNVESKERKSQLARCDEMTRLGGLSASLQNDIARGDQDAMEENEKLVKKFLETMRAETKAAR